MKNIFKFICCGNVDDGKSTLIGRLLLDSNSIKQDQLNEINTISLKNGNHQPQLSLLLDGLAEERNQQITIDIAHRYFNYNNIRFHILDCPGHKQYIQNMAIAAATTNTALMVIDCLKGIQEQTIQHLKICALFHIKYLCICITKCDLILTSNNQPDEEHLNKLKQDISNLLKHYPFDYTIIPVSAYTGYNMPHILNQLYRYAEKEHCEETRNTTVIMHIQGVKFYQNQRWCYGKNLMRKQPILNNKYMLYPNNIPVTITHNPVYGCIQLKEDIDISAGSCITNTLPIVSNHIQHQSIWFDTPTNELLLRHGTKFAHVVQINDNYLELDEPIIFHNINEIKENGFGIFIDQKTKKTVGCCTFIQNTPNTHYQQIHGKTYWIKSTQQVSDLLNKNFIFNPIVFKLTDLKHIFKSSETEIIPQIKQLTDILNKQGKNVIICNTKDLILPINDNDFILI